MFKRNNLQRLLLLITAIEGVATLALTAMIPGERNGNLPGGFSTTRFCILIMIAIGSVLFFLLSLDHKVTNRYRTTFFEKIQKHETTQAIITVVSLFILFFPPIILRVEYQAQFFRLFFFAAWFAILNLQMTIFKWVLTILENGADAFLQQVNNSIKPILPWIICILFPILFLTPRLWVFGDRIYTVGNDFVPLYAYKVYLLDFLVNFRMPLWSPSESAGFPFLASPLTQAIYPLNIPLAVYYWWHGSYGLIDHTWYSALGISIFACGMFAWLRQFRWKETYALIAALITSIAFPLPELLRFTFAIHNYAWLPCILFYLTDIFRTPLEKKSFQYYLGMGFVLFSFVTASYTYYVFYSIFLLIPYSIVLLLNPCRRRIGFAEWKFSFKPIFRIFLVGATTLILLSPYLINIVVTLFQVTGRGIRDFDYSTQHLFSWIDILGSFVYPPVASAEGWFYIGIIPLSLLINYFISPKTDPNKNIQEQWYQSPAVKITLAGLIIFVLSLAMGRDSIIFKFFWDNLPFFYSFRNWGRFCIMLLPLFGFGLAASLEVFFSQLTELHKNYSNKAFYLTLARWTALYLLLFAAQSYARTFELNGTWSASFYNLNSRIWLFQVSIIVSWIVLLLVIILSFWKKFPGFSRVIPPILVLVTFFDLFPVGAFQWLVITYPEENPPGRLNLINNAIPSSFRYPRTFGKSNISLTPEYSMGPYPTWYYARYWDFFFKYASEEEIFNSFLGKDNKGRRIFITPSIDYQTIAGFMKDAENFPGTYEVTGYDGENLQVDVESREAGFLSFIDNWDPFWTVKVNDEPAKLEKLFDTFKSVKIPAGKSTIRFEYKPEFFPLKELRELISN